ncbi:MAG: TonB-dependent receptor [Chitinophagales bacterium]|nr:TonB-dependent receptor [Chitinophagales bacterium]
MKAGVRNRTNRRWKALVTMLSWSVIALAQTGVGNEEVIVVKEYEAKIQDAQKLNIQPNIPETEEKKPTFDYTIPAKDYKNFAFEPNPLKPVALSKEKVEKYNTSFVKIGFGSQLMPLAQLAYNDNKTKNLKFGIFYNHLSAHEFKVRNQRFLDDEAGVYLRYYPKTFEVGTAFTFRNYRTHFYSVDTMFSDTAFKAKDVRQVFRNYDASVYFGNSQKNKSLIDFRQSVNFNYLQETYGKANEWFIAGTTAFSKTFKQHHAALADFNFDISRLKNDSLVLQRNIFRFDVGYSFDNDDWEALGKFGLAIEGKKVFILADAHLEKRLYQHALIAYLGYHLRYDKNSLNTFAQNNNFIHNWVAIQNSHIGDFSAGVKGTAGGFSYNASFHFNHINRMPLFVSDTADMRRFVVVYDSAVKIFNVHLEAGYNVKEWLRFALVGDYNFYQLNVENRPWHLPTVNLTFRAQYIWQNKVKVGVDLFGITNTYAKLAGATEAKIKGTADVNLSLEYIMSKHVAFFGNLNNIANFRYQRWYNYPGYGINGMVGAKFSF